MTGQSGYDYYSTVTPSPPLVLAPVHAAEEYEDLLRPDTHIYYSNASSVDTKRISRLIERIPHMQAQC